VIVLTLHDEPEYVAEALHAGASGYVLNCSVSELVTAIRAVLNGHSYLTPSLVRRVDSIQSSSKARANGKSLTLRQREVLQLVAQGRTAKEIACTLGFSVKTAVFHKMAIMDKLGLRTTADLTRYALDHGILSSKQKMESLTPSAAIPLASDSVSA
jgi:DNA-binding NarL/FixJ family response regulator